MATRGIESRKRLYPTLLALIVQTIYLIPFTNTLLRFYYLDNFLGDIRIPIISIFGLFNILIIYWIMKEEI